MQKHVTPTTSQPFGDLAAIWLVRAGWRLGATIAAYTGACLAAYDAVAQYEELSRLSDAELGRRGLSRTDLYRAVFESLSKRDR